MGLVMNMLMVWTLSLVAIAFVDFLTYQSFQLAYLRFLTQLEWLLPVMSGISGFLVGYKKADFWTGLSIVVLIALWIVFATAAPMNMIVFSVGMLVLYLLNTALGFWGNAIAARQKLSLSLFFGTVVVLIEGVFFFLFAGYSSLSPYSMFNPQWFWSKDTYAPELTVNAFGECLEANRTTEKPFTGVRYHYDGNLRLDLWTHRPKGIEFFINGKRFGTSDFAELPNRMLVWNINKNPRPKTFMLDKAYPQTIRNLFGRGYVTYFHFGEGEAPHTFVSLTGLAYEPRNWFVTRTTKSIALRKPLGCRISRSRLKPLSSILRN